MGLKPQEHARKNGVRPFFKSFGVLCFGFYHSLHRKYAGDQSFIFRPLFFAGPVSPARQHSHKIRSKRCVLRYP